ncbi:hypothetical protein KKB83_04265 [Patescibacteria group bacterium]|nr:hypothetical protein [Patescibacteria group bacterium]
MTAPKELQEAKDKGLNRLEDTDIFKALLKTENKSKPQVGRPKIIDTSVLRKLYEAFIIGSTDEEACFWANIGKSSLYAFQIDYPEFLELKEEWKQNPTLKARQTVFSNLDSAENARWYLERKKKEEFAVRSELTGASGVSLLPTNLEDLKTNYGDLAKDLIEETSKQGVENDPSLQDKEQGGGVSNL